MRARGFTLVEALVGVGLLSILLVVLAQAITSGLRAQAKGEAARVAMAQAREMVSKMTGELGTAQALDPLVQTPSIPVDFLSAVVWPDCYNTTAPGFPDPPYKREHGITVNGTLIDRVTDRLIFTRPATKVDSSTFNQRDYSQFVYVEYVVPPADGQGRGQNRLLRRLYQVATTAAGPPRGNDPNTGSSLRFIVPNFFAISTYDANDPLALFNNPNTTVNGQTGAQKAAQSVVLELPNDTDRISFTIEHAQNRDTIGLTDPVQLNRLPFYDSSLFNLDVTISVGLVQSSPEQFLATRTLSGQARVKSGS